LRGMNGERGLNCLEFLEFHEKYLIILNKQTKEEMVKSEFIVWQTELPKRRAKFRCPTITTTRRRTITNSIYSLAAGVFMGEGIR